jgi:hypothetical protein
MQTESLKLHSAARAYCQEQHDHWASVYGPEHYGGSYTDKDYDTFPRYLALSEILNEVEKIDADDLPSFAVLSRMLQSAGRTAESPFIDQPMNAIASAAIRDEREKFCGFIESLTEESVGSQDILPYRRVLSPAEVAALWEDIKGRWGADRKQFWYPLTDRTEPSLSAFDDGKFRKRFRPPILRRMIARFGVERLYELREYGDENYVMSVELWDPFYNFAEGYWVSKDLDWILYASHEGTMTVGGRLKTEVIASWPDAVELRWG